MIKNREEKRISRHSRIRAKIKGTASKPRLAVFKSNKYISAQVIDDVKAHTIASVTSQNLTTGTPMEKAAQVGTTIGELAKKAGVDTVVFDRGGYIYTGKVAALADAARTSGLTF
jgi:large subunit ribosomal protein L18